jgi:hypothetical protein
MMGWRSAINDFNSDDNPLARKKSSPRDSFLMLEMTDFPTDGQAKNK